MKRQDYLEVTIKCFYKIPNQKKFEGEEWEHLIEHATNDAYDAVNDYSDAYVVCIQDAKVADGTIKELLNYM